ncbi:ROK family protein [Micromonospora sp. WMMD723]|uniref:ROK family protein n=1 Tax=unclassified Micromonospora TaxID=2617518 RepID=UPI003B933C40
MTDSPLDRSFLVADIGGTTLRVGWYRERDRTLAHVHRIPVEGLARHPGEPAPVLRQRVLTQLAEVLGQRLSTPSGVGVSSVGLAFAGPLNADGMVLAAPTIWGGGAERVPLGAWLAHRLGVPVRVRNDLTAAAWRYAGSDLSPGDFCLLTVSSGIGNKVFRDGAVLVDPSGTGGELGHWPVDLSPDGARCDCGGRGHLGAVSSGRGILSAVRSAGQRDPRAFAASTLGASCPGGPGTVTNEDVVRAVLGRDAFAVAVLRRSLRHLAQAIVAVHTAIGIRRYVIIGGFAQAVGDAFADHLVEELVGMGCFGLTEEEVRAMVTMGVPDDDHALIGMGRLLSRRPAGVTTAAGT